MRLVFTPWQPFYAIRDKRVDARYLDAVAHESEDAFKIGLALPKSGVKYPNLPRRSSRPGEYPANQSGELRASIDSFSTGTQATVGSNVPHSLFLLGTSRMRARKMSHEALLEAMPKAQSVLRGFVRWGRR